MICDSIKMIYDLFNKKWYKICDSIKILRIFFSYEDILLVLQCIHLGSFTSLCFFIFAVLSILLYCIDIIFMYFSHLKYIVYFCRTKQKVIQKLFQTHNKVSWPSWPILYKQTCSFYSKPGDRFIYLKYSIGKFILADPQTKPLQ